jgi:uncharacterized protein
MKERITDVPGKSPGRGVGVTSAQEEPVSVLTADDVRLHGVFLRPPAGTASRIAVVVGHGVTHHVAQPGVRRILDRVAREHAVVALDFRGHGRSAGTSTMGDAEVLDVEAAAGVARTAGFDRIVTLGFSLGGSVVLRHAALHGGVAAVVAVSAPSRWWIRETPAMRRVHWLLEAPHGRLAARALGLRLGPPWGVIPASPVELVADLAPTPLLLVHGTDDHYFPPAHATALHRAAGPGSELWLEPGVRHAESAMTPALIDRITGWISRAVPEATPEGPTASDEADPPGGSPQPPNGGTAS